MSMSADQADTVLDNTLVSGTPHLLLHTGDPGSDGTLNIAQSSGADIDRKAVSFAAPGNHATNTERRCLSDADVSWGSAEIDDSQTVSHFSVWPDSSGTGNVEYVEALNESKTVGSDGATVSSGDLEVAIEVYAKP